MAAATRAASACSRRSASTIRSAGMINEGGDEALIARHAFLNAPNLGSSARALVRARRDERRGSDPDLAARSRSGRCLTSTMW